MDRPATRAEAIALLTAPGQPYELVTEVREGRSLRLFRNAPASLRTIFEATATQETFFVYGEERLTFASAWARAGEIAAMMQGRFGVEKGDRVAISMRNYPEWVLAFMGTLALGAVPVAMNSLWTSDEMAFGLEDSGAKLLFADAERVDRALAVRERLSLEILAVRAAGTGAAATLGSALEDFRGRPAPPVPIAPTDRALFFYTSGSTGHPKGVVTCHEAVVSALLSWELDAAAAALVLGAEAAAPAASPGALLGIPLFHVAGCHAVLLSSFRSQRKVVSMYRWDPEVAAELIERERLTTAPAPAAVTGDLVRIAREGRRDLSSLLTVGGGGAPRAPEQVSQIGKVFGGALPLTGWGMTETSAIGTGIYGQDYLEHPASSGRCSAVLELRVVDEAGRTLPPGARGELLVRGASMFEGYWNRPEVNREVFVDGDWFRTGDMAMLDEEGYLYIVDRIKDLIIRGGENIGCGQVEAALLACPGVREAAAYAVPDERLGEEVGATLYGDPDLDLDDVRRRLSTTLARYETPRYLFVSTTPLPRTASGKILKRQLRDEAVLLAAASPQAPAAG